MLARQVDLAERSEDEEHRPHRRAHDAAQEGPDDGVALLRIGRLGRVRAVRIVHADVRVPEPNVEKPRDDPFSLSLVAGYARHAVFHGRLSAEQWCESRADAHACQGAFSNPARRAT
jgi:hypothetical protein